MDSRTLRLLELPKILSRLEAATASSLGRERVQKLSPSNQAAQARRRLRETGEARRVLDMGKTPSFGGVSDIRSSLKKASIGSMLEAREVLSVSRLAQAARKLRDSLNTVEREEFPILRAISDSIEPQPQLEKAVAEAIDEASSEIRDDASLDLLKARRNARSTQAEIQDKLRRMISDVNVTPHLQDAFVTIRDGRYCLPVRAESRRSVPGIVHDRSGSGGAFFVEPQAVVDLNNRLRELALQEREAIVAILTDLTGRIAGVESSLRAMTEACGDLDFAFAKAHLSRQMKALEVPIEDKFGYRLLQARHPLIETPVPNDIYLGDDSQECAGDSFDVMMITGPNTGGKTVVLKTLGLLALMAGCGLHLPVEADSWLGLPGAVYADIGDEQSIEQSLSTFSSHIGQIVKILKEAKAGDLILLDEIGAGTDPDEGAALAKAVLRALQRRGCRVVSTTHYGELKQFALGSERFVNASVEFDAASLKPTYRLRIGVPGASNALDIAARLKMPPELVSRARRYLGRDRQEAEVATQRLEETQRELTEQAEAARRERQSVEQLKHDYELKISRLREATDQEKAHAQTQAREVVRRAQDEADAILRDLRRSSKESKQTEEARGRLRSLRERVQTSDGAKQEAGSRVMARDTFVAPSTGAELSFKAGDRVRVKSLDKEGTLLSAPDESGRVAVRIGALRVQLKASDLEKSAQKESNIGGVASIQLRKALTVADEINLIGQTTDEAIPNLEKYLDDAILADSDTVRIVHGKGSGALRTAVHRFLKGARGVREWHLAPPNEGGDGATVVSLG